MANIALELKQKRGQLERYNEWIAYTEKSLKELKTVRDEIYLSIINLEIILDEVTAEAPAQNEPEMAVEELQDLINSLSD